MKLQRIQLPALIAAVIHCNSNVRELHLHINMWQAAGAIKIARAVQEYSTPQFMTLTMENNQISIKAIARSEIVTILSRNNIVHCKF